MAGRAEGELVLVYVPKEVFQNCVMAAGWVAKVAQRYHSTGLNADPDAAKRMVGYYTQFSPAIGKDILEIGPGQTFEVLEQALAKGAKSCSAVDVVEYVARERAKKSGIDYRIYQGKELPFATAQFDLIWSSTAFEHLRYPDVTVDECFRVLRPGGLLIAQIDLGDHSFYPNPDPRRLFEGLKYPTWLWNLMKWNRSSYVNRLRKSDWLRLVTSAGFRVTHCQASENEEILRLLPQLTYLHSYSREDAITSVIFLCAEKPRQEVKT